MTKRGGRTLAKVGIQAHLIEAMLHASDISEIVARVNATVAASPNPQPSHLIFSHITQLLEVMANDHWVTCDVKRKRAVLNVSTPEEGQIIYTAPDREAG